MRLWLRRIILAVLAAVLLGTVLLVVLVVGFFSGIVFGPGDAPYTWNQRMTLALETPAGPVTFSNVTLVYWKRTGWTDGMGWHFKAQGEAAFVELAPGRYLFALLKGAGTPEYIGSVAGASIADKPGRLLDETLFAQIAAREGAAAKPIPVPSKQYPLMVTFDDIADPASVKRVDPADLAATFGPGYRLASITLEITDDPVTEGEVEKVLGWLGEHSEPGLCPATGRTTNIPFCRRVHHGDFIRR